MKVEKILVNKIKNPKLNNPVMIVGLPGIGNVGKIAVEYLIDKLKMTKMIDIITQYLPPQVFINEEGLIHLAKNSIYYKKRLKGGDLMILTGDFQGTTQEGQYELCYQILQIASDYKATAVYTLGGYSIGKIIESPRVLGAVSDRTVLESLKAAGVLFPKGEPGGGIVGSAGLILGLATEIFGMHSACLMGETSGYFADPKGATQILKSLTKLLSIEVDLSEIEERSKQIEEITGKMQEGMQQKPPGKDDLGYFG
ncbi:MAG: proteasome assembly chaperone family protein [Candidatus Thermoplasmatota archaeon]|jgi:uncharacterized protein (TIGR00162 family)|nr:proteasome assembly chaperone family protein [Candidatus Thermoplasmatota archaeon]